MTAILNKLVSACQTIEASAGSGGGGSGSVYSAGTSLSNKANYPDGYCYVPICGFNSKHEDAMVYIKVNGETFYRYYIEVVHQNTTKTCICFKLFKNSAAPSDSTELTFSLVNCSTFADGNMLCLKVSGIDTVISDAFTIFYSYTYNGITPAIGDSSTYTEESAIDNTQFVPVTPSA